MNELISIIVPVYKVEKYLEKCVRSIMNQTYRNIEIILIDDGSPDESGKMCDELAKLDDRIVVIHKENEGLSATRNVGIEKCNGKYVAFVDSDDWISEDYCETLYKLIVETDSDVSAVSFSMVREDNTLITGTSEECEDLPLEINVYENKEIVQEILNWKTFKNYAWNKLYKKELINNHRFLCGMNYEDVAFTYEVLKDAKRVAYINKKCYFYLKRRDSISATCSEKNLDNFLDIVFNRYTDIARNNNIEKVYNIYALLEAIISISIKYVIANSVYPLVDTKSEQIFIILKEFVKDNEKSIIPLLSDFQKASIYLICYNKELFYKFLRDRQEMKRKGLID